MGVALHVTSVVPGLSWDLSCLISLSVTWGGDGVHSHQVCRCHQLQLGEGYLSTYSRPGLIYREN